MVIERSRQVLENPLGLLGGRTVPRLTQHFLDPGVQGRIEPVDDVAPLVHLAALDQRKAKVSRTARLSALAPSTMNKWAMSGCSPRSTKSASS
jgi:hypothetical protein